MAYFSQGETFVSRLMNMNGKITGDMEIDFMREGTGMKPVHQRKKYIIK